MGLLDNLFRPKMVQSSDPAQEVLVNEVARLNHQNLILQKSAEALQVEVNFLKSEAEIATPIQPLIGELPGQTSIHETDRKVAALYLANALRQLLTERLIGDLKDSELKIRRLSEEAEALNSQVKDEADVKAKVKRLTEREATINKNFAELQRRESALQDAKSAMVGRALDKQREHVDKKVASETADIKAQLAHVRELLDAASAKLQDQEQLRKRVDAAEIENSALKKGVSNEVWALKRELGCKIKEIEYLNDKFKSLARRDDTVSKESAELQRRESELKKAKSEMNGCTPEVVSALKERIKNLQDQVRILTLDSQKIQIRLQDELKHAEATIKRLREERSLVSLSGGKIVEWMLEEASPEQAQVDHGYLSLVGDGPWDQDQLGLLMEQRGFSLWELPDRDVRHVVLGRKNWDAEKLEEQIYSAENIGQIDLRFYSQEMWLAKLVTGRDPFDSGDKDLLMAFAKGHDALKYLIARDKPWPEVTRKGLVGDTPPPEFGESPLHNFGYKVGVTSGLSERERRAILANFLEAKSLSFDPESTEEYRSNWGRPNSVQRLFRVALHIKWLIEFQGKGPFRAQAYEEWTEDLKWLKKTFYKPTTHKFKWPTL